VLGGWTISGVTTMQNGQPFTIVDTAGATIYGAGGSRAALADPVNCDAVTGNCQSSVPLVTSGGKSARVDPNNPNANWLNPSAFTALSSATATSPYCIGGTFSATGSSLATCGAAPNPFAPVGSPAYLGATYVGAGIGYGNSGKGAVLGPGQFNFDMVLMKNTKVAEWGTLQFRVEAFNVWNH